MVKCAPKCIVEALRIPEKSVFDCLSANFYNDGATKTNKNRINTSNSELAQPRDLILFLSGLNNKCDRLGIKQHCMMFNLDA